VEPNEIQLKRLFEALCQELGFQWQARYVEVLPGGVLVLSFEHAQLMVTGWLLLDKTVNGFGEKSMFNIDYHAMSDGELVDRLEKGEMQTNLTSMQSL